MMTIQKPKRQFQKKKSYLKRKLLKKFEGGKDQMSYKDWLQKAVIYKGIDDLKGYDYEGWYNEDPKRAYAFLNDDPEAHFDDKYKTVYHPTFSDQSIYSGVVHPIFNPKGLKGGRWVGDHKYISPKISPVSMDDRINYVNVAENDGVQIRTSKDEPLWMDDGTRYDGVLPQVIVKPKHNCGKDRFTEGTDDNPKRFWETEEEYKERLANTDTEKLIKDRAEQKERIDKMNKDRELFLRTKEGQRKKRRVLDQDNSFTKNIKIPKQTNSLNNVATINDLISAEIKKPAGLSRDIQDAVDNQEQDRKDKVQNIKNFANAVLTAAELGLSGASLLRVYGNYKNWKNGSKLARGVINLLNKNQVPMQVGGTLIDGYQTYNDFQNNDYKNGIYNTISALGGVAGSIGATDVFRNSITYRPYVDTALDAIGTTQNIADYLKFGYDVYNKYDGTYDSGKDKFTTGLGNNGIFNSSNPNIYKSISPLIIGSLLSQDDYNSGKDIHIKKANKGKFTETANRHNMGVQEFANKVLNAPKGKYSSTLRKRANFARNFAH